MSTDELPDEDTERSALLWSACRPKAIVGGLPCLTCWPKRAVSSCTVRSRLCSVDWRREIHSCWYWFSWKSWQHVLIHSSSTQPVFGPPGLKRRSNVLIAGYNSLSRDSSSWTLFLSSPKSLDIAWQQSVAWRTEASSWDFWFCSSETTLCNCMQYPRSFWCAADSP